MIVRLAGMLESVDPPPRSAATIRPGAGASLAGVGSGAGIVLEVLLPAFVARRLVDRVGEVVTLHTLAYLESQNQGASFTPRLIGFLEPGERQFFELFTTVKGIGNRRALRALAEPVAEIAAAVERGDGKALSNLPEIGKRMAETVIAELRGKLAAFAVATPGASAVRAPGRGGMPSEAWSAGGLGPALVGAPAEAVEALARLGEARAEAERKVARAVAGLKAVGEDAPTVEAVLSAALGVAVKVPPAEAVAPPARAPGARR